MPARKTNYQICKEVPLSALRAATSTPDDLDDPKILVPVETGAIKHLAGDLIRIRRWRGDMTNGTIRWIDE